MPPWSSQHYKFRGESEGIPSEVLDAAVRINERIRHVDSRLPTILTLRHLSVVSETPFLYLRKVVGREGNRYKRILLRKKVPGRSRYREIHIPEKPLLEVQGWIAEKILRNTNAHPASFAYHPDSRPVFAAKEHCGCLWLLKVDLEDFFHRISEGKVFYAFKSLGYSPLLSFELARITTMVSESNPILAPQSSADWNVIPNYKNGNEGFLPQGAPSSPMISNLVMKPVDERLTTLATSYGFKYTRYADDLAFSTDTKQDLEAIERFKRRVLSELLSAGFNYNRKKTVIRGPGDRRIVLGMLVDGRAPRLVREFKDNIRQHLYYLNSPQHGPSKHAINRKTSVSTLYHHVRGKVAWAEQVEPGFGAASLREFEKVSWPPFDADR